MSTAMMSAPSSASRTAWLRPWPRAAPVMKATLPCTRPMDAPLQKSDQSVHHLYKVNSTLMLILGKPLFRTLEGDADASDAHRREARRGRADVPVGQPRHRPGDRPRTGRV